MDERASAELQALRRRAYGLGGGIAADPDAARRLRDLEDAERAERAAAAAAAAAAAPALRAPVVIDAGDIPTASRPAGGSAQEAEPWTTPEPGLEAAGAAERGTGPEPEAPQSPPARRRFGRAARALTWAGSLVLVAAIAVSATMLVTARTARTATALPEDSGITHVTTLLPDADAKAPEVYGGPDGDALVYDRFVGLTVFASSFTLDDRDTRCLGVAASKDFDDDEPNFRSFFAQGCSAGVFPASAEILVDEAMPPELLERYPAGSALQFVLTPTGVDVFVAAPIEPSTGPSPGAT